MQANRKLLGSLIAFALLIPVGLWAQGGATGAITGVVQDQTGAVLPSAKVIVINKATGATVREVSTTSSGSFNIPLLSPGTYRLEVAASGFASYVAEGVAVRVTETSTVNVTMRLGTVTENVTVRTTQAPIQLTSATTGQTIGAGTASTLPLSTRNFLTLLTLSAGANTELFDSAALGRGEVTINVNGQRPTNNNYQLEGINANDINLPTLDNVPLPNPDTLQEFKTQTSLYDASQGRNGGGNIQVNLKSGADKFHGDAYGFFRNNVLNANDFFLNSLGQPRPVLRQNQFGGSLGGPVPLGKQFFFFVNYQGTRAASGASQNTFFSTQIPVLPASRTAASLTQAFFPNGLPQGSSIDSTALAFLNLPASKCPGFDDGTHCIPTLVGTPGLSPNGSVNPANISRAGVGMFQDDQFVVSVDKQVTSKDKFTGRSFFSDNTTTQPFGTASTLPFRETVPGSNRFLKLGWTRVLSPNLVNDFRFGFNRFTFAQQPTEPVSLTDIGATRPNSAQFPAAYQVIVRGGGAFSLGTGVNDDRGGAFNTFEAGDDFSISRGKHLIRLGFEASRYQLNRFNNFAQRGSVTFADTAAGDPSSNFPALTGFQNFLLGRITTTQAEAGFTNFAFRATDYSGYLQDDWKFTSRLTLNLGLRWEGLSTAHELNNFLSNFRGLGDGTPGPISIIHPAGAPRVGTPGVSDCTLTNCFSAGNFAPRIGFAWDTFGNQKTVLRGGYGIYYQRVSNQSLLQTSGGLPFNEAISAAKFSVTPENPFPSILPNSAFPLATDQVVPALAGFDSATGAPIFRSSDGGPLSGFFFFPVRNFRSPYAQQWNLNVQRQLFNNWVLEVGYVGTHGVRLLGTGRPRNPGQICTQLQPCVIPASIGANVNVPSGTPFVSKNADGSISITGSTRDNINARVPAQFLGLANSRGFFQSQDGNSIYHSLQATLSHHFSGGLYFQGAYTFSRSIDNSSGSVFQDELTGLVQFGDLLNQRANRALSDFDRTHRLVASYNYELPIARLLHTQNQGLGKIANGWSVNGVTTFQSGTPFTVFDASALTLQDTEGINGTNFATLAPGATLKSVETSGSIQSRLGNFVNLSGFIPGGDCVNSQNIVVPCSINGSPNPAVQGAAVGNVGRNTFRGPFQQNWDFSLVKNTKVTETTSVDFRTEFFNVFNHPSLQSPQAGALSGGAVGNLGQVNVSGGTSAILATVNRPRIVQFALKLNF